MNCMIYFPPAFVKKFRKYGYCCNPPLENVMMEWPKVPAEKQKEAHPWKEAPTVFPVFIIK